MKDHTNTTLSRGIPAIVRVGYLFLNVDSKKGRLRIRKQVEKVCCNLQPEFVLRYHHLANWWAS